MLATQLFRGQKMCDSVAFAGVFGTFFQCLWQVDLSLVIEDNAMMLRKIFIVGCLIDNLLIYKKLYLETLLRTSGLFVLVVSIQGLPSMQDKRNQRTSKIQLALKKFVQTILDKN